MYVEICTITKLIHPFTDAQLTIGLLNIHSIGTQHGFLTHNRQEIHNKSLIPISQCHCQPSELFHASRPARATTVASASNAIINFIELVCLLLVAALMIAWGGSTFAIDTSSIQKQSLSRSPPLSKQSPQCRLKLNHEQNI